MPHARLIQTYALFFWGFFVFGGCDSSPKTILVDRSGNPVPGSLVRLISIDDLGVEVSAVSSTITDENGEFSFPEPAADPNASLILVGNLSDGTQLRGFYAGYDGATPIHPLTEAFVSLVVDITETEGQRSLSDFVGDELSQIAAAVFDAAQDEDLDLNDPDLLKNYLRSAVGRPIAEASGGSVNTLTTLEFDGSQTQETIAFTQVPACPDSADYYLLLSTNFQFDIQKNGNLCGGNSTSLDPILTSTSFEFVLPGQEFTGGGDAFPKVIGPNGLLEDEREVVLGPSSLQTDPSLDMGSVEDDVTVTRKVYVPETGDYVRYVDIVTNDADTDRTYDLGVNTTLETGSLSTLLAFDTLDSASRYLVAYDVQQTRPTVGFAIQDGLGSESMDLLFAPSIVGGDAGQVQYLWEDVTVPPHTSRVLMHFGYLSTSQSGEELSSVMESIVEHPDITGMSRLELASLINFAVPPGGGTIEGEAGYVIGLADVTATNLRTSESVNATARNDGSFSIPLDTQSSDEIHVTASDGLDQTLLVP